MERLESRPAVRRLSLGPTGLIASVDALAAGLSPHDIRLLVHTGVWVRVRRGFFVHRDHWAALDDWRGKPLLAVRAAYRAQRRPHVVSHTSAALVLDLPHLRPHDGLVHLTQYGAPRARVRGDVKHHQARFDPTELVKVDGISALGLPRTALDIAREHGFSAGVCAIDAARQRGVTLADLEAAREPMWHWPFVTVADDAVAFSDPGAESIGETLTRILLDEMGLGPIQTQFELRDATGHARCDLRVGRHVFEFEGLIKLLSRDQGGVADRPPADVLAARQSRHDWVCGFHLGMSHVVWDDLWGPRREQAKRRLRREYDATVARFGTSIADLAPYIVGRRAG